MGTERSYLDEVGMNIRKIVLSHMEIN